MLELHSLFSRAQICWLLAAASPLPSLPVFSTICVFSLSWLEVAEPTEAEMQPRYAVQEQQRRQELGGQRWVSAGFECPGIVRAARRTPVWMNMTSRALQAPTLPWLTTLSGEAHLSWHLPS